LSKNGLIWNEGEERRKYLSEHNMGISMLYVLRISKS